MLPTFIGILLWNKLPDQIATHFDLTGEPNGYSSRFYAAFGLPVILLACHFLCAFITKLDPKKQNISDKIYRLILWICPLCSVFVSIAVYGYTLGFAFNVSTIATAFAGSIFVIIGNYLPKCKQNYSVGIRTPWALNDEANRFHTHRFSGYLWVIDGILMIADILIQSAHLVMILLIVMVVIPYIYSFLYYYRNH